MSTSSLHQLSAFEQKILLEQGEIEPETLLECYQERASLNPEIGAFVSFSEQVANELLSRLPSRAGAPLWGLPHADKDLAHREGTTTLYGSLAVAQAKRLFPDAPQSPSDPIITQSDSLGLVSFGKTNTPEFGLTGYTESAVAPAARHPQDLTLNAGGSSGGAAAAVAARVLPAAIGSDGGGSVRIPAATVGIVGLKPGRNVVTSDRNKDTPTGVVSGPMARDVRDTALYFGALSGKYPQNWVELLKRTGAACRVAVATDSPWNPKYDLDPAPEVLPALERATKMLQTLGHALEDVSLQDDAYADLFQGAWFRAAGSIPPSLDETLFEPITRWLVSSGRAMTASDSNENIAGLRDFQSRMEQHLEQADIILTPALGLPPQVVGSYPQSGEENFARQVAYSPYTSWVNIMGWPAITVPVDASNYGHAGQELKFSVQLIGKPGTEWSLLQLAANLERLAAL